MQLGNGKETSCKSEFVAEFLKFAETHTLEDVAVAVWKLANDQWKKGYNQGKFDPDFDEVEDDDVG